jgi:hypothetical protein
MRKILILLAVATLPAASGCACGRLCPCCPCNWFNRPAVCAPACPPPVYAAPVAATCPPPCAAPAPCAAPCAPAPCAAMGTVAPMAAPMAAPMMPQYMAPQAPCCAQAQPMYYQQPYQQPMPTCCAAPEPSCAYSPGYAFESGCGGPYMGNVGYGPVMDWSACSGCGGCGACGSCGGCTTCNSCCDGGASVPAPAPEKFVDPAPAAE